MSGIDGHTERIADNYLDKVCSHKQVSLFENPTRKPKISLIPFFNYILNDIFSTILPE